MNILVKTFDVNIPVKSKGIELGVRLPNGKKQIGDCYIAAKGLIWCQGKVTRENGVLVLWQELMEICDSKDTLKAALKAAKAVKAEKQGKVKKPVKKPVKAPTTVV